MAPEGLIDSYSETIRMLLSMGIGVAGKILYDWIISGRKYMTIDACVKNQHSCYEMVQIRRDFTEHSAIIDQKMSQTDKQMSEGQKSFKEIATDISSIKSNLAVISSWLERNHR